jgi:hypothetical protein
MTMERKTYSFDGRGINGPDEYRTRLATLSDAGHAIDFGRTIERAVNAHDDVVAALELADEELSSAGYGVAGKVRSTIRTALAKAKGE